MEKDELDGTASNLINQAASGYLTKPLAGDLIKAGMDENKMVK